MPRGNVNARRFPSADSPTHPNGRAHASTPPRILVGTVLSPSKLHALPAWAHALNLQSTDLRWDVLLAAPQPLITPELHRWVRSEPFGSYHRLRLRAPENEDEAARLLPGKLSAWVSYSALLMLDLDVRMPPHALQRLHEAGVAWATCTGPIEQPAAPLACALLSREAVITSSHQLQPTYVPDVRWERIPAPDGQAVSA